MAPHYCCTLVVLGLRSVHPSMYCRINLRASSVIKVILVLRPVETFVNRVGTMIDTDEEEHRWQVRAHTYTQV